MKILIAGEGKDELGFWAVEEIYRTKAKRLTERGVIDALLRKLTRNGIDIIDGIDWKNIFKYSAKTSRLTKDHTLGLDGQRVLGLLLYAEEKKYDAVIFVRDRDDQPHREKDIKAALKIGREFYTPKIAGGVAAQAIESWLLSLKNEKDAERYGAPKDVLRDKYDVVSLVDKVAIVDNANLDEIRQDAQSLRNWLTQVRAIMNGSSDADES